FTVEDDFIPRFGVPVPGKIISCQDFDLHYVKIIGLNKRVAHQHGLFHTASSRVEAEIGEYRVPWYIVSPRYAGHAGKLLQLVSQRNEIGPSGRRSQRQYDLIGDTEAEILLLHEGKLADNDDHTAYQGYGDHELEYDQRTSQESV